MDQELRTQHGATLTTEGYIPHKIIGGHLCCVKLDLDDQPAHTMSELQRPRRLYGHLVYAMPGGADCVDATA